MSETLARVAAIVGLPGFKGLCALWGGGRLYVSATPAPMLVDLLGETLAVRLAIEFAGETLELPVVDVVAVRRAEAQRLRAQTPRPTISEIAVILGVSRQTVTSYLAEPEGM